MYTFFYKPKEDYVNKYTLILAFITLICLLAGVVLMFSSVKKAMDKMLGQRPIKLRLIVLEPDNCKNCFEISKITDFVKNVYSNVEYKKIKKYKASDKNAESLIKVHKIEKLPTFILQGNLKSLELDKLFDSSNIKSLTKKEFVYKNHFPPYYDLSEKKTRGQFSILYLTDKNCKKCYDVNLHKTAFENLVMRPISSSTVEAYSTAGKNAIKQYNIKYAPTILLRGDLDAYQDFKNLWKTVGTIEKDGTYVFRESGLKLMGAYKNINTWKMMNVTK